MANILGAAVAGDTKTHIMYKCNLSFKQFQAYLDLLLGQGLLEAGSRARRNGRVKIFATTDKGRAFLKAYGDLKATFGEKRS